MKQRSQSGSLKYLGAMKYLGLLLAVQVGGCGGGDTHYVAAFLTTQSADALAAARAAPRPAPTAAAGPQADAAAPVNPAEGRAPAPR